MDLLLPLDIAAQAGQRDAGVVGDGAIGEDLAFQILEQRAEIADRLAARAEPGEALGDRVEHALGVGGAVEHAEEVEDLLAFQAGAFDAELVDGLGEIGEAAEVDADGGAARGGLRARGGAQIFDGLAGIGQIGGQAARHRCAARSRASSRLAGRAGHVAAEQGAERFVFQDIGAGGLHLFLLSDLSQRE